jgi:hypothetical protein
MTEHLRSAGDSRLRGACLALLVILGVSSGCGASQMPRGAVTSERSCSDDSQCEAIETPQCFTSVQQCYNGLCLIKRKTGCIGDDERGSAEPPPSNVDEIELTLR